MQEMKPDLCLSDGIVVEESSLLELQVVVGVVGRDGIEDGGLTSAQTHMGKLEGKGER